METFLFVVTHFIALLLLLCLAYLAGEIFVEKVVGAQTQGRIFLYCSMGLGAIIVLLFLLSLANLLSWWPIFISLGSIPVVHIFLKRRLFFSFQKTNKKNLCITAGLIAPFLIPAILIPLYPPHLWDELSYHLPYARFYVENSGLAVQKYLRYPLYAHNINLLYSLSLIFLDDILAHLIHSFFAILTALGIYQLGKEISHWRCGFIAASIFFFSGIVTLFMGSAYIDLGMTLFVFMAFYCLLKWVKSSESGWLILSGFATGIAVGSKYSGLVFAVLFLGWVILETRKPTFILKYLLPVLIIGSPWYIRNFLISGDPVHPFGTNFFGSWLWNARDLSVQTAELAKYGTPRTLYDLIELPKNLLLKPELYQQGSLSLGIAGIFLAIFFLRGMTPLLRRTTVFALINLLIWFTGPQIYRYLLPTLPIISLVSAYVFVSTYDFLLLLMARRWSNNYFLKSALILPIVIAFLPAVSLNADIYHLTKDNPLPATEVERNNYMARQNPVCGILKALKPSLTVYQMGFENSYYCGNSTMIGDGFGIGRYSEIAPLLEQPEELHKSLNKKNVKIFLLNKTVWDLKLPQNFQVYFDVVYDTSYLGMYVLK